MITVSILINGHPILTRSASRIDDLPDGRALYGVDDGSVIQHNPDDGCIPLAHKMLDCIKETVAVPKQGGK